MSDNKRPYDDEQVNINDLNDDLDKTKVFNLNSNSDIKMPVNMFQNIH